MYTIIKCTREELKLPHENLLRHSLTRPSTKNLLLELVALKNDKNTCILPFVELHFSTGNQTQSCVIYCTMGRLLCAPKVTKC